MALKEFRLPDIGEGIAEGEIVSWRVEVGQQVKEEDEFVEVMTDKATVVITVPFDGVIAELRYKAGYTSYLDVLDNQRNLLEAERQRILALRARQAALVDLYKALGGGWSPEQFAQR